MVILISGTSHTGKTLISQKLLEKLHYPYLSIDHLKMGLYRGGKSNFNPLTAYSEITKEMWPVLEGIIKTCIENEQNIILEGCFIPKDYHKYFTPEYLKHIKYMCIILSDNYLDTKFDNLTKYANVIEKRLDDDVEYPLLKRCNKEFLDSCNLYNHHYYLVNDDYNENEILEEFLKYIGE